MVEEIEKEKEVLVYDRTLASLSPVSAMLRSRVHSGDRTRCWSRTRPECESLVVLNVGGVDVWRIEENRTRSKGAGSFLLVFARDRTRSDSNDRTHSLVSLVTNSVARGAWCVRTEPRRKSGHRFWTEFGHVFGARELSGVDRT